MLVVRTKTGISNIEGIGLFADQHILAGEKVWMQDAILDPVIKIDTVRSLDPIAADYVVKYGYSPEGTDYFIVCGDDARFINHSDDPNLLDDTKDGSTIAARDILPGEELTIDYRTICQFWREEPYINQRNGGKK